MISARSRCAWVFGKVRGRLALGGFALLDLGTLRIVVEFRQQRASLHKIALVDLDADYLTGDLETNFGNDLRFDCADAEYPNFDILFGRRHADNDLAFKAPIISTGGNKNESCQRNH